MKPIQLPEPDSFPPHDPDRSWTLVGFDERRTNGERAKDALSMLRTFRCDDEDEYRDLMTNLLHLAHSRGLDPATILHQVVDSFIQEAAAVGADVAGNARLDLETVPEVEAEKVYLELDPKVVAAYSREAELAAMPVPLRETLEALDMLLIATVDNDLAHGIGLTEAEFEAREQALAVFEKYGVGQTEGRTVEGREVPEAFKTWEEDEDDFTDRDVGDMRKGGE